MRSHYTADKYHLLDLNCNSFTNDCAGFLTGGSIPAFVRDLPTDFLDTISGAALRPAGWAMYSRPSPVLPPSPGQPRTNPIASSLLEAVASQKRNNPPPQHPHQHPFPATKSLAGLMLQRPIRRRFRTLPTKPPRSRRDIHGPSGLRAVSDDSADL
ncbi:hypothetical protein HMN09_01051200 [Mycena chlorophos]|uniref:PPPDE domain-containing protein n=1 Tax=Mycena chlorophos TaxID=658473 RepID=A0A8H6VZX3_MYCCL|nr:hypothetical protein HMN09_01051200 [Mycena chlorophos]